MHFYELPDVITRNDLLSMKFVMSFPTNLTSKLASTEERCYVAPSAGSSSPDSAALTGGRRGAAPSMDAIKKLCSVLDEFAKAIGSGGSRPSLTRDPGSSVIA